MTCTGRAAGLLLPARIGFYAASDGKTPATMPAATEEGMAAYFSPRGGCTETVFDALSKAKQTVLVQAYSFTPALIANPTSHREIKEKHNEYAFRLPDGTLGILRRVPGCIR